MKHYKINLDDGKGAYHVFGNEDVVNVNPIDHYSNLFINHRKIMYYEFIKNTAHKHDIPESISKKFISQKVLGEYEDEFNSMLSTEIPKNLIKLLTVTTKKEQIKLTKNQELTTDSLLAFICKAFSDFGYLFSEYRSEHFDKGTNKNELPKLVYINDNMVEKVGDTSYSNGKLKHAVNFRKVIIAKFLSNNENWHCFVGTFKSIYGEENWEGGKPHLHYFSNAWGIKQEDAIKQIKEGRYPLTSVHIGLVRS